MNAARRAAWKAHLTFLWKDFIYKMRGRPIVLTTDKVIRSWTFAFQPRLWMQWPRVLNIQFSWPNETQHGVDFTTWPWWKRFVIKGVDMSRNVCPPSETFRFWLYTRRCAGTFDWTVDRRKFK